LIDLRRIARIPAAPPAVVPTVLGRRALLIALLCLLLALVAGLITGPVRMNSVEVVAELAARLPFTGVESELTAREAAILWEIRMPRVVLGAMVGAMLSAAGAAYQGVFRNPLADPYLLGAASGAALGATLAIEYGASGPAAYLQVPVVAFAGALIGVGLAYALGRSAGMGSNATALILAGVAVASFLTAVQTYLAIRDEQTFREASRWILGRLSTTGWREVLMILPYVTISGVALLLHRRLLDVLSLGEDQSRSLGVHTSRVRVWVILAASLGTAAAVAVGGLIGFVGIIVPHTVRLLTGTSYRLILPLSLISGAAFLVLADLLARTVLSPAELPIGVVTAFFGAPFFAVLLRKGTAPTT
jgi:iron complex transport system permease protein